MKKTLTLLILILFSLVLCACNGEKVTKTTNEKTQKPPEAMNPQDDFEIHEIKNTLHSVNVNFDNPISDFIKEDETSEYQIIYGDIKYVKYASFISRTIYDATGVTIPYYGVEELSFENDMYDLSKGKFITFGDNDFYSYTEYIMSLSLSNQIGKAGYVIKTENDDCLIKINGTDGAQIAALAFLRATLGYEMYSDDLIVFSKDGRKMPSIDIKERPDYEYRIKNNQYPNTEADGLGVNVTTLYMTTTWGAVHNLYDYVGGYTQESSSTTHTWPNAYEDHPLWFSDDKNQPCFLAHGNSEEFEKMTSAYAEGVFAKILQNPNTSNIRFSQNDNAGNMTTRRCTCAACNASFDYYGQSIGGALLQFTNRVAEKTEALKAANGLDVTTNYIVLCYGTALRAPTKLDASGSYALDENGKGIAVDEYVFDEMGNATPLVDEDGNSVELVCHENVHIEFAPSGADWWHSFYESQNNAFSPSIKAWCGLSRDYGSSKSGQLFIWAYEAAFFQYLYPYNNFDSIAEQIRFFKECGANYYYSEGTYENPNNPGFTKIKDYLVAKLTFDCNLNYQELVDDWFLNYFGPASGYMKQFFYEIQAHLKQHENDVGGYFFSYSLSNVSVWPEGLIRSWMRLIDKSMEEIKGLKTTDPELYKIYYDHIQIESLFPRFVLCTSYANSFDSETLKELRIKFKEDFAYYKNTTHQERYTISDIYATWDMD